MSRGVTIGKDNLVFGFGSLINTESLRAIVPDAKPKPAHILGFRRSFSVWDPLGFTQTNLDIVGMPFCALDIVTTEDAAAKVNGVIFEVNDAELKDLQVREAEYQIIQTTAYNFASNTPLGECLIFSANRNNGSFAPNSPAQEYYLQLCLDGAKEYGETFYQVFLATTYIGDQSLVSYVEIK